jgi:hypothetical protein
MASPGMTGHDGTPRSVAIVAPRNWNGAVDVTVANWPWANIDETGARSAVKTHTKLRITTSWFHDCWGSLCTYVLTNVPNRFAGNAPDFHGVFNTDSLFFIDW